MLGRVLTRFHPCSVSGDIITRKRCFLNLINVFHRVIDIFGKKAALITEALVLQKTIRRIKLVILLLKYENKIYKKVSRELGRCLNIGSTKILK